MQATAERRSGLRLLSILLIVILASIVIYYPVSTFRFVQFDDPGNILNNPLYQPSPDDHLGEMFTKPNFDAYIPVTRFFWGELADTQADPGGMVTTHFDPGKYHVANAVLHILNALLVFGILKLLVRKDWAAALGTLVFAVHPLQVEPVSWVTGAKDVLSAFFALACILLYLLFVETSSVDASSERPAKKPKWGLLALSTMAYLLALLSKSTTVVLPLIVLIVDYAYTSLRTGRPDVVHLGKSLGAARYRVATLVLWIIAALPASRMAFYADHLNALQIPHVPIWQRLFVAGDAYTFYLTKLFCPVSLSLDYGRTPTSILHHAWVYPTILVPVALILIAWRWRSLAWPLASIGIFLAALLPVSGLAPFTFQAYSTVCDRYMYLAMLGVALAVAGIASALKPRVALGIGLPIVAVLTALSMTQVRFWADTKTLAHHVLAINPSSNSADFLLGMDAITHGDIDGGIADFRVALQHGYQSPILQQNLGVALLNKWVAGSRSPDTMGLLAEAAEHLETAARINPGDPAILTNLGNAYLFQGRVPDAVDEYQKALAVDPNDVRARKMLEIARRHRSTP